MLQVINQGNISYIRVNMVYVSINVESDAINNYQCYEE